MATQALPANLSLVQLAVRSDQSSPGCYNQAVNWEGAVPAILVVATLLLAKPYEVLLDKLLGIAPDVGFFFKPWKYYALGILGLCVIMFLSILLLMLIGVYPRGSILVTALGILAAGIVWMALMSVVYWIFLRKFHLK